MTLIYYEKHALDAEGRVRLIQVIPLLFGRARIGIGPPDLPVYDDEW